MKRKLYVLFCMLFLVNIPVVFTEMTKETFLERLMTHSFKDDDIQNILVENNSGLQRVFSITDGFQERVLSKVVYWLNNSDRMNGAIDESEVMKFYPNKTQKYMWHIWGDEQELDGKFTVVATNQDDGQQVPLLTVDRLSGPNNGADRHLPSHLTLPKEGMWKLDAYIEEKPFGTIYVQVHKE